MVGAPDRPLPGRPPGARHLRQPVARPAVAASAVQICSTNPANPDDVVGTFVPGGGIDVDRAVTAAAAATDWAAAAGQARADALSLVAGRVEARAGDPASPVRRGGGKPIP